MRECPECGSLSPDSEVVCVRDGHALTLPGESDPRIGQVVGSYTITARLGQGGMGSVYLGQHPDIGSHVAIKILSPRFASDPAIVERFFNEARAVNLIGHENIVQIFDFGHLPDRTPYLVMEWLNGKPLSAELGTPMPVLQILPIALQIADALQAAHDAGIVHRDLKPDNIFLVPRSHGAQVKVLDFGIAKLASAPVTGPEADGVVMGTAGYLSPEQAAGDAASVSPASDVYALGVILYQLACGHLPFRNASSEPDALPGFVAPAYGAVILRCLRREPSERFASMRELRTALLTAIALRGARRRVIAFAAVLLIMAGGVIGAATLRSRRHEPTSPGPAIASVVVAVPAPQPPARVVADIAPAVTTPMAKHAAKSSDRGHSPTVSIPAHVGDGMIEVRFDRK